MTQYMISVIHAEEGPDWDEEVDMQEVLGRVDAFNKDLQESGFWVIEAPDLDAALEIAKRGSAACMGAVEVRRFQAE